MIPGHKPVRKVLDKIRKLNTWQRHMVLSWLNDWNYYQSEEARELNEDE
jgi:hypothetical protein